MSLRERLFLLRLRERDEEAFSEMVLAHQDRVFGLLYRMIGDRQEAEDLAQEVFITVFRSIEQFRGDAKLSTWIYRIAANQCKNRLGSWAREQPSRDRDLATTEQARPNLWGQERTSGRPDVHLEERQRDELVQRAISELEEDQRLLVVLRDVQGLSYQEIVEITGLEEGTVKSRLHRARMRLRSLLGQQMGDGT